MAEKKFALSLIALSLLLTGCEASCRFESHPSDKKAEVQRPAEKEPTP